MNTYTFTETLKVEECCSCHMTFAMTRDFKNARIKDHTGFYCPAGHRQYYFGESEEEKLKIKLANAQEEVNWERTYRHEAENKTQTVKKQRNALKGHLGRAKKRAAAGTCPCCKRTFKALSIHMLKQHPQYVKENQTK